jgi:hydroxymethylglutaryl-CoA synthase
MLIDEEPDIVALSTEQGYGSADETDFLKPNQQFPSVDGKRSIQVYLARMREALEDFESIAGGTHPDSFAYFPFHTPYPGMVRKAALLGYRHITRDTEVEEGLSSDIGMQPRDADFDSREAYENAIRAYMDDLKQTGQYREWYDQAIGPTVDVSGRVGNWYTGSVHLARLSALRAAAADGADLAGQRLLVGSYGSGAQAEIHAETVQEGWRDAVARTDVDDQLDDRYDLSFEEYELVHDVHNHQEEVDVEAFTQPEGEFVFTGWGRMSERRYEYVE